MFCSGWELKEGDGVILEGKNITLSHVNHVPDSVNGPNIVKRNGDSV